MEITHTHTKIYIKEPLFLFSVFFEGKLWQATTIRSETNCKQRPVHSVSPLFFLFYEKKYKKKRERTLPVLITHTNTRGELLAAVGEANGG